MFIHLALPLAFASPFLSLVGCEEALLPLSVVYHGIVLLDGVCGLLFVSTVPTSPIDYPPPCLPALQNCHVLTNLYSIFRYLRLIVNLISNWTFKPTPIPDDPSYTNKDVTVIIPTIEGEGEGLERTIQTCLMTKPFEMIIVTVDASIKRAERTVAALNTSRIRILSVAKANKRSQMCAAIPEVTTSITIFADDDVIWPKTLLPWILAPFEDAAMGGVGTSQRLMRPKRMSLWSFLGSLYLERRNFDCSACLHIDGGLPCLSGRTVAYRTRILQDEAFTFGFAHETWRTFQLNADDDNFITRWLYSNGWKITMQYHKACEVQTTLEDSPKYLKQCLRWVRSNWRSNLTSMFVERHCWRYVVVAEIMCLFPTKLTVFSSMPWTTYAVFQTTLTAWAFTDLLIFFLIYKASEGISAETRKTVLIVAGLWIFVLAKTVKLYGHWIRYPADLLWLPIHLLTGLVHGFIKLAGLMTLSAVC
jgi:cellulose synthase/poly-beta-1,6-N-acetylglucosamine synthase-like glycosyltransferase